MPFNAENFMGILTQHMYKAPVPIRALVDAPDCPPGLEAIILKCLSKKPDARYQTWRSSPRTSVRSKRRACPKPSTEMMARSGGFNVPADYFKNAPAVVPATPTGPGPSAWDRVWSPRWASPSPFSSWCWCMMSDSTTTAQPRPTSHRRRARRRR